MKTKKVDTKEIAQTSPKINFVGPQERLIPKLCTGVFFQIVAEKLILTLTYHEGNEPAEVSVIERVALDMQHAKSVSVSLQKTIEDFEKNKLNKEKEAK